MSFSWHVDDVIIRQMNEEDIEESDRIIRLAFGTFRGIKDPENYRIDAKYAHPRYFADPSASFVAELNGKIIGSNFGLHWGSIGIFGPLTIHPDYWDKGIGSKLMRQVMRCFEKWKVTHSGAMTFANSPKHISLYRKLGYNPRFLIPVMSKKIEDKPISTNSKFTWLRYSENGKDKDRILQECNKVTNTVYPGLDLRLEIKAVDKLNLGDTVILLGEHKEIIGFAVCHCGVNTEAGAEKCYVKFGAVSTNSHSEINFTNLLNVCEEFTVSKKMKTLVVGVNIGRHNAYQLLLKQDFIIDFLGVSLHQPNNDAYNTAEKYVLDDWR